ncbi:transposable element Tc3 transposase [Trichonephila clavipes]|nr:transposable element Tc3 transposase [Trichonephila clavipes]
MLNGRTKLHIFDTGLVTRGCYCDEIIQPHACLFRSVIGPDFIFVDDNARSFKISSIEEFLERARSYPPENTRWLKQMLIEE